MKNRQKIECVFTVALMGLLAVSAASQTITIGQEYYVLSVNGKAVGAVAAGTDTEELILKARRQVMQNTEGYALVDAEVKSQISSEKFQQLITNEQAVQILVKEITDTMLQEKKQAYTITSGTYSANFESKEQAVDFLEQVKNHTEGGEKFSIALELPAGEKEARKAEIVDPEAEGMETQVTAQAADSTETGVMGTASAGIVTALSKIYTNAKEESREEYQNQTGILAMEFADNVYGYENFVGADTFADVTESVREVTKEKETNTIYVVEAGDCLSIIAEKFDTTMESIVGLNQLESEEATLYLDQELIVAVPRPDISLRVSEGIVYEENYTADPEIIPNDAWYTTKEVVLQEGTEGYREVNALVTYENGLEAERKTLHITILAESVPAVVEQGTQIPPTYIKPISGGRFTSGFGKRWGRMHKGVDWAVSIGTPVSASSAGTVSVAGAVRGYGYAVYISHPDGRQTRYGHLSKVLVTPGQWVEQGQNIALSGNTGRSTGPHLHFEILIDGSQVNPLNYMN